MKSNFKFSDIQVSSSFTHNIIVTEKLIDNFVSISGDNSEVHINKCYALGKGFNDRVMHGVINLCFISKVIGTQIPGDSALLLEISAKFRNPVYPGNNLEVNTIVSQKHESINCISLKSKIFNKTLDNISCSVKSLVKVRN